MAVQQLPKQIPPKKGSLGCNLAAAIISLWSARLPIRRISAIIESWYRLRLSAACINNSLYNASESVEPFVDKTKQEICNSRAVHFDETGYPINGNSGWAWVATNQRSCFVTVESSRGACILQRHFGPFAGVAVTDGWRSYGIYSIRQRCWAHILRESRHLAERTRSDNTVQLHRELFQIFSDAKSGL